MANLIRPAASGSHKRGEIGAPGAADQHDQRVWLQLGDQLGTQETAGILGRYGGDHNDAGVAHQRFQIGQFHVRSGILEIGIMGHDPRRKGRKQAVRFPRDLAIADEPDALAVKRKVAALAVIKPLLAPFAESLVFIHKPTARPQHHRKRHLGHRISETGRAGQHLDPARKKGIVIEPFVKRARDLDRRAERRGADKLVCRKLGSRRDVEAGPGQEPGDLLARHGFVAPAADIAKR